MAIAGQLRWSFPVYPLFKCFQYAAGTTTKQYTAQWGRGAPVSSGPDQ
jgi:hypothetical protein